MKAKVIATSVVCMWIVQCAASRAWAQQVNPDDTLKAPYTTSTGATVPNPGKSQSGGTTSLDRNIQRQDNRIDGSICKGC